MVNVPCLILQVPEGEHDEHHLCPSRHHAGDNNQSL